MGIKHAYQSATSNDGAKEVSSTRWNEDHTIDGEVTLPVVSSPATPAADNLNVFARKVGGRVLLGLEGPSGLDTALQPHIGGNSVAGWFPAGNSATMELKRAAALTATGSLASANVATTNLHSFMKRIEYLVTTAATTAVAGFRSGVAQFLVGGPAAKIGGFHFRCRFGPATGVATSTNRLFVGLASSTAAPTDVQPSSITNIVGVGWDAADTNIQIMYRATGTINKVDTGIAVPTVDRTSVYELGMFSPPGTTQSVEWVLADLVNDVEATGVITSNLPATTTLLAPRGWISAGGTSSVIGLALMGLYIETDY